MASPLRVLEVDAGIAGFSLGLKLAGAHVQTVGFVERQAYCAALLLARMEEQTLDRAPVWCGELQDVPYAELRGYVDLITAGFPCQPWSDAGIKKGVTDERWQWPDIKDLVAAVEPSAVFLENVKLDAFREPFGDLRDLGFELPPPVRIGARDVGAPHKRYRFFALAYRDGGRFQSLRSRGLLHGQWPALGNDADGCGGQVVADASGSELRQQPRRGDGTGGANQAEPGHAGKDLGDTAGPRQQGPVPPSPTGWRRPFPPGRDDTEGWAEWDGPQPGVRRDADGIPARVDRLHALGNAVMPQVVAAAWTWFMSDAST